MLKFSGLPRTDTLARFTAPYHWFCDTCGKAVPDSEVCIPRSLQFEPYHRWCGGECVDGLNSCHGVFQTLKGRRTGRVAYASLDLKKRTLETQRPR